MKRYFQRLATRAWLAAAIVTALAGAAPLASAQQASSGWKAGAAKTVITPDKPLWMSGYASRDHGAEGKLIDLYAKAIVLEDPSGRRAVLVSLDLVGIDRDFSRNLCAQIEKQCGLARDQVSLCCSHTHCGPIVGRTLMAMFFLDDHNRQMIEEYTNELSTRIVGLVGQALQNLAPATIAFGQGQATFAVNRRTNVESNVPQLRERGELVGPVDHDVPVLSVRDGDGKLEAIVFGYACHATVMSFHQWSGDYPGFAQLELERSHPEAVALFFAGCGADQNPLPRREDKHAPEYGKQLAQAVERTLAAPMTKIDGELKTQYMEIPLAFDTLPDRAELERQAAASDKYIAQRAKRLLGQLDRGEPLSPAYPYPVQTWKLGQKLLWVHLGGEVVVDYAVRLKREISREATWVAGYANDVMAYIPSRRVLGEGGYEGATAMIYYGLPTSWGPSVEESIVGEVHRQAGE